jgi:hypothetical protein
MRVWSFVLALMLFFSSWDLGALVEFPFLHLTQGKKVLIAPVAAPSETLLKVTYQFQNPEKCSNGIQARIKYQGRTLRANLIPDLPATEIALGKSPKEESELEVFFVQGPGCRLSTFQTTTSSLTNEVSSPQVSSSIDSFRKLALIHSPFIAVRGDQQHNPFTDIPLDLAYSIVDLPHSSHKRIRYTVYFSDEDSISSTEGTDSQMAKYGRRTDIEWVYEVELNEDLEVVNRHYQGGYVMGIGHRSLQFQGEFLPDSQHPILYDIADHNVFSDRSPYGDTPFSLDGYHFAPTHEISYPLAREWLLFKQPWMLRVSDEELKREQKLSNASTDFLYVLVDGKLINGSLIGQIAVPETGISKASGKPGLRSLGQDLWNQQSFAAIPLGQEDLEKMVNQAIHGIFSFAKTETITQIKLNALKFFRVKANATSYQLQEITHLFKCHFADAETSCHF